MYACPGCHLAIMYRIGSVQKDNGNCSILKEVNKFVTQQSCCHLVKYLLCTLLTPACCKHNKRPSIVPMHHGSVAYPILVFSNFSRRGFVMAASLLEYNTDTKMLLPKQRCFDRLVILIVNTVFNVTIDPLVYVQVRNKQMMHQSLPLVFIFYVII